MALKWVRERLPHAQPTDLVFIAYVAFTGALFLIFGWTLPAVLWAGLVAAHLAQLAIGVWFARQPLRDFSWKGVLRDVYPILLVVFLYWELRHLSQLFTDGYYDAIVLQLEEAVFGEQLALTVSERWPYLWLSEIFHFFYAIYWALLPLAAAGLYLRRHIEGFRDLVFVEIVIFFFCYLIFTVFPVAGPHYQFPVISGPLAEGPMYRFVHWVLEDGGSKGAAFPSSHVAVAVGVLLVTWRHDRLLWAWMLPLVTGLTLGTVYGRFHYGIDAATGILTALLVGPLALRLQSRLRPGVTGGVGNSVRASAV